MMKKDGVMRVEEIEEIEALWKCCETFRKLREVPFSGSAARMPWGWWWLWWWWWFGVAEEDDEEEEEKEEVEALWWLCSAP